MADLTTQQKKDYARTLYLKDNLTQQEIADKVGVSRQTIIRWVSAEKWEELKAGMTLTREQQVASLHRQVSEINRVISGREEGKRFATAAEADTLNKLATGHQKDGNGRGNFRYHQCRYEVHQLAASVRPGQKQGVSSFVGRFYKRQPMTQTQKDRDALREWAVFYEAGLRRRNSDVNLTQAQIARERARLEADPVEWIKFFFPEYCKFEFADFQTKAIRRCIKNEEWFEVLSWARGLAKSTTVMFIVMYLTLTGRKCNVMMASATQDSATRLLDPYKKQFEENALIRAYYGVQVNPGNWCAEEFVAKCGCSFRAVGAGNAPRGSRNGAIRPGCAVGG